MRIETDKLISFKEYVRVQNVSRYQGNVTILQNI